MTDANAQAMKFLVVAHLADDVPQTVLAAVAPALLVAGYASRQIQFVVDDENLLDIDFEKMLIKSVMSYLICLLILVLLFQILAFFDQTLDFQVSEFDPGGDLGA